MRTGTIKTADDVLAELIGDAELIAEFLSRLQDDQMPCYDEAMGLLAHEVENLVRKAVATARAGQALVEREQSGASLQ